MQIKCSSPIIACRSYLSHVIILLGAEEPILQTSDPRDTTMLKVFPVITDLIQSSLARQPLLCQRERNGLVRRVALARPRGIQSRYALGHIKLISCFLDR